MRIGPDAAPRFAAGSALIVGAVDATGAPWAMRAWGAAVLEDGAALRIYVDADDRDVVPLLAPGAAVAVTGGCVRTLASAQVKGRVRVVDELTALDVATRERATELFARDVNETDHTPRELIDQMVPERFVACTLDVEEMYDQTPGPQAGASLPPGP
ncbi:MAG: hypothetical protein ACXVJ7_01465 [Acidimicrobiia bacterium]